MYKGPDPAETDIPAKKKGLSHGEVTVSATRKAQGRVRPESEEAGTEAHAKEAGRHPIAAESPSRPAADRPDEGCEARQEEAARYGPHPEEGCGPASNRGRSGGQDDSRRRLGQGARALEAEEGGTSLVRVHHSGLDGPAELGPLSASR